LVGLSAAKALAVALEVPLIAINHVHAHLYACRLAYGEAVFPCVGLVVSGGHTNLYRCAGPLEIELIGGTVDDAAGEAFDKVAAMLGLGYPGGPAVQTAAEMGDPRAYAFPRTFLNQPNRLAFSFSGLKTAVRYQISTPGIAAEVTPPSDPRVVANLAASFQEAAVDVLVGKSRHALTFTGFKTLCVGGGVAANRRLRERLAEAAAEDTFALYIAPPDLCTDNAVMGAIAVERLRAGLVEPLDLDVLPGLVRGGRA
jgi:tRNA N6-adenosine threonylcarbamoyltransferase